MKDGRYGNPVMIGALRRGFMKRHRVSRISRAQNAAITNTNEAMIRLSRLCEGRDSQYRYNQLRNNHGIGFKRILIHIEIRNQAQDSGCCTRRDIVDCRASRSRRTSPVDGVWRPVSA